MTVIPAITKIDDDPRYHLHATNQESGQDDRCRWLASKQGDVGNDTKRGNDGLKSDEGSNQVLPISKTEPEQ